MRAKKIVLLFLLAPALLCSCGKELESKTAAPNVEKKSLPFARIASRVADRLPHAHLNRSAFDDSIATNALVLFIDSLDFDHTFFLASDIREFQLQATELDDLVKKGDIEFAQTVFERFKERATDRVAYANQLLDNGFDLTIDETYRWKREKEPWPDGQAKWDELWRKKIKNEYVGRVAMLEVPAPDGDDAIEPDEDAEDVLSPEEFVRERYKQYQLMIENNFDRENILERYLSAFTQSYDPHSAYLSPRGVEDFDIHMSLSLVGIGAMLQSVDGAAKITRIIPGGPAEADGRLKMGDKIIAVAQDNKKSVNILFWPLSKAVRLIRGEIGTKVVLTIIPAEDKTGTITKKIDLVRAKVKLEESAASGEVYDAIGTNALPHRLGVVTLPEFYADFTAAHNGDDDARRASTDIRTILKSFSTNNVDGLILDLRNDGGGSLPEAIDITGLFIPFGPVVQVRNQRGVAVLPDGDPTTVYRDPLVVLVNRISASASEIVAAALQDYGRAVIVGDSKTHGKGTVQTVLPLSRLTDDLGSLKVTTASFYRIKGGSTQLRGVTPDVILPSLYDTLEIGEEFLPNALPWTRVNDAYFREWRNSVKPFLPELHARSATRMVDNPSFTSFLARRERLRERMENPQVSLQLSERVKEILAEQEMEDLFAMNTGVTKNKPVTQLDSFTNEVGEVEIKSTTNVLEQVVADEEKKEDPTLDEALLVLSDLIELSSVPLAEVQRP